MSWSAKTFWNNHSWPSSESIGNRGGIVPTKSGAAKDPAEVKHDSTVWLFRDALTFSDVLIGIDFVRGKMWASQTVTLDLLQKSVGNPWRNRAVFQKSSMKAPCDFFEVHPWPSQRWIFDLSAVTLNTDLHRCPDRHRPCRRWDVTFWNNHFFYFLQSQSRIGRNQAERTNEIRRFAWQQRVVFSRCLDLHRCQLGLIVLSLALMLSDVWSALTLSEERCASLTCNWSIRTSFLRLLLGFSASSTCRKKTCFAISASYLWNVVLTLGRMPVTTRRIGTISALTCVFIPFVNRFSILFVRWFSLSVFGCLRIWCGWGRSLFLFMKFAPVTRSSNSMMETTRVSFRTLSSCTLALISFRLRVTTPWIISFRA